ncbi:MAG TPA: long-chain fatty acid--CoA ligase, partial [Alphaproteobacteria bacterium]|nr:long-chain fatty acid--CoA ligase [Alphaproteobacteria bacterium]
GCAVKIVGPDGAELPPEEVGEICVRSPANMAGYWKLPDASGKTLIDGWVHTGDAGFKDADGYVYLH